MDGNSIKEKPAQGLQEVPASVEAARRELDEIDGELIALLAKRRGLVKALFLEKQRLGLERFDPAREALLIAGRKAAAEREGLPGKMAEDLFRMILEYNRIGIE